MALFPGAPDEGKAPKARGKSCEGGNWALKRAKKGKLY